MLVANVQSLSEKQTYNHFKLAQLTCNHFILTLPAQ